MQAQAPAFVETNMSKLFNAKRSWTVPSAHLYAAAAVRHVGYEDHAVPFHSHALERCVTASRPLIC